MKTDITNRRYVDKYNKTNIGKAKIYGRNEAIKWLKKKYRKEYKKQRIQFEKEYLIELKKEKKQ